MDEGTILNKINRNGRKDTAVNVSEFEEVGTPGLESTFGHINKAYTRVLEWPSVEKEYSRIWRSDAETTLVRNMFSALTGTLRVRWELPELRGSREGEEPTDDDLRALDFAYSLDDDLDDGLLSWLTYCMERVSFYGWGWWEAPLGKRSKSWRPPHSDEWRSQHDDGLVGLRRLAFRDYSSLERWELDDRNGRLTGMWQLDYPNPSTLIPLSHSLHVTYGDSQNPEGLATLEALYRLERLKYAFELVLGIGSEHAAGHVKFQIKEHLDEQSKAVIRRAARSLLTASEGNYITEIVDKFSASVMDVPFSAGANLLEAIRYYGLLKLSIYGMQFAAISSLSGVGSYSALSDSSSMAMLVFNSMKNGYVDQFNKQITTRIFEHPINAAAFPNMSRRPQLVVSDVSKTLSLAELGSFMQTFGALFDLSDEDVIAVRAASGFLPESLPEDGQTAVKDEEPQEDDEMPTDGKTAVSGEEESEEEREDEDEDERGELAAELARNRRPFAVDDDEEPISLVVDQVFTDAEIDRIVSKFERWAASNDEDLRLILRAEEKPEEAISDD